MRTYSPGQFLIAGHYVREAPPAVVAEPGALGRSCDRPDAVWRRYAGEPPEPEAWVWTPGAPIGGLPTGKALLLLLSRPATFHLGVRGWSRVRDLESRELGLGPHGLRLEAAELADCANLEITWRWRDDGRWLGEDFSLRISPSASAL